MRINDFSSVKERFLHFIWQYKFFHQATYLSSGELVECLSPGTYNTDAGPDFLAAKIRINGVLWVGNVEIHVKASDWFVHHHDQDASYDSIILHVVLFNDRTIYRKKGEVIPCLSLEPIMSQKQLIRYEKLLQNKKLACQSLAGELQAFTIVKCMEQMGIARLQYKANLVEKEWEFRQRHWEACFFTFLCRSFGGKVNANCFEQLSRSIPLNALARQKTDLKDLEAIFFGQAGFLENNENVQTKDEYLNDLRRRYKYLQIKYSLKPMKMSQWKLLRMRPNNFPLVRLSQLANLTFRSTHLFSNLMDSGNLKDLFQLLECEASAYWKTHYHFDKIVKPKSVILGEQMKLTIIINAILPILFLYGRRRGKPDLCEKALELLESLPPEMNSVVRIFKNAGIKARTALHSQAILHLYNEYCLKKKCLDCGIGYELLKI